MSNLQIMQSVNHGFEPMPPNITSIPYTQSMANILYVIAERTQFIR